MAMACSDTAFHKKIAGKYRLARRMGGRRPQLVYRGAGKNAAWGALTIRLDFRLPKVNAGTFLKQDRAGLEGHRPAPQWINLVTERRTNLYRYMLDSTNRLRSVSDDRPQRHKRAKSFPAADPIAGRPARTTIARIDTHMTVRPRLSAPLSSVAPDGAAANRVPSTPQQGTAKRSPFNYRPPGRPQLHQETGRPADPPGRSGKSMVFQGLRPLAPVDELHRFQRGRAPENSTTHLPGFSRLIRHQGTRGISLVHTPSNLDSVQKSPAAESLPERRLPGSLPSRRPSAPFGLFPKAGTEFPDASELVFKRQRKIESEIEELKKVVAQVGEQKTEALPTSSSAVQGEIRRQIDLERISDQVYRTIERRIRQERERRGV